MNAPHRVATNAANPGNHDITMAARIPVHRVAVVGTGG
jgi:hypothetical protein